MVHCQLVGEELPGLEFQTYPGDLGKRIFDNISAQAWQDWLRHQTMLINEHRLSPINPEHRKFLESEMEKFFFGGGSEKPSGFVPN
jgi:Fe-S cluster biosynthesis and repair protein YggX